MQRISGFCDQTGHEVEVGGLPPTAKLILLTAILLVFSSPSVAMQRTQGWCQNGGVTLQVGGLPPSAQKVQGSYPNCLVSVYYTGTSSLAPLYADNSGTVLPQPFHADPTTGYWFFYANSGRYDIRFSGAGIYSPFTWGDVLVYDPATLEQFNVIDFGADPTGATDSTANFLLTYAAAISIPGATFLIPAGTYKLTPGTTCTDGRVAVICDTVTLNYIGGPQSGYATGSILQSASATADILNFSGSGKDSSISGITFSSTASPTTSGAAIVADLSVADADGQTPLLIQNNTFLNVFNGIELPNGNGINITGNRCNLVANDCVLDDGAIGLFVTSNNFLRAPRAAFEATSGSGITGTANQFWGCLHELLFDPPNGKSVQYVTFNGLTLDWASGDAVVIGSSPATTGLIWGINLYPLEFNAYQEPPVGSVGGYGVHVLSGALLDGLKIIGGSIRSCLLGGIQVDSTVAKNIMVDDVDLSANGHDHAGGGYGFSVAAGVGYFTVHNVTCGATWGDDLDAGNQLGCVNIPAGASTNFHIDQINMSGGPPGAGPVQDGPHALSGGPWSGRYFLNLAGGGNDSNNGNSLTMGAWILPGTDGVGTVPAQSGPTPGSVTIHLATYLQTLSFDTNWQSHTEFRVMVGLPGSQSAAIVSCLNTQNTASCVITQNLGDAGSGVASISGTVATDLVLTNAHSVISDYTVLGWESDSTI